jgi:hypothetical protein
VTGRPKPENPGHEQWQAVVRANVRAGRTVQRVHVVAEPLSQYMQLELTWGYGLNAAAGENIRIIPVHEGQPWPLDVPESTDYWLFDSAELYQPHYDSSGMWLGTEVVTHPARIVAACHWRDAALYHAVTWQEYISDKPELARRVPNLR